MAATSKPPVLIILDGFGHSESPDYNAVYVTKEPVWDRLLTTWPHGLIPDSGMDVSLPDGQMGNSEAGHVNLGVDRVVCQGFTHVTEAIRDDEFFGSPTIAGAIDEAATVDKAVRILGLPSPGGIHSHEDHLVAVAQMAAGCGVGKIYLHAFLDGCSTPSKGAQPSLERLDATFTGFGKGRVTPAAGRYFATDRDNRWDRVQAVYELAADGKAEFAADSSVAALEAIYTRGESDEFVKVTTVVPAGAEATQVEGDDVVIFMNFRADRARELSCIFVELAFNEFPRERAPQLTDFVMLIRYAANILALRAFPPGSLTNVPGEYLAKCDEAQLRITETEKHTYVTFFFSDGREEPYEDEERILIPSLKVVTYNLQPEMSAPEITDRIAKAVEQQRYDVIVVNYASGDMVGHTDIFETAVKAAKCPNTYMGRIVGTLDKVGGEALIITDHGNIEQTEGESADQTHTMHTCEPVPFAYVSKRKLDIREGGVLADIAPTTLTLAGLEQPAEVADRSIVILG